jgi:hypothetical protein
MQSLWNRSITCSIGWRCWARIDHLRLEIGGKSERSNRRRRLDGFRPRDHQNGNTMHQRLVAQPSRSPARRAFAGHFEQLLRFTAMPFIMNR